MVVVAAESVQMDPQALERVERLFRDQIEKGLHPGAALAVYRHGQPVLDLYGGLADASAGKPVAEDTMFVLYSCTKPLAAACLYILWERGRLAWDDPVARHWPEFAQNGKAGVTIRHVLTHQAGFPETPRELTWDKWRDWGAVVRAMSGATPVYEPGTVIAYHSINFGWVIAELVRRIDGRPFNQFLREELTVPLGMSDTYVGLPPSLEGRVSRVHPTEDTPDDRLEFITNYNRPEVHEAVIPAACGIATARDLVRFYAMMQGGGALEGVRILKPETVAEVTRLQSEGMDRTIGQYVRRSLGLALGDERMGSSGGDDARTFGHGGAGTSVGWADPDSGLAIAYITNGFRANGSNNPRLAAISQAVRNACSDRAGQGRQPRPAIPPVLPGGPTFQGGNEMPSFWETIKVNNQDMRMYASVPTGSGPFPAVVVSMHGGGVDEFIRSICDRLAQEGYAAVAPDLFHRITQEMLADGSRPIQHLSDPDIVSDINATVDFLRNHPAVDGERIGVTGFCMGGRVTWLVAASNAHFKAAVPYYGGNIMVPWGKAEKTPFELTSGIKCPVLFHFGEIDANPSQEDMKKLDAELTRLGKPHQFYVYPGADHAFMDHTGARYQKAAADASWPRTLEFFATHLKRAAVSR